MILGDQRIRHERLLAHYVDGPLAGVTDVLMQDFPYPLPKRVERSTRAHYYPNGLQVCGVIVAYEVSDAAHWKRERRQPREVAKAYLLTWVTRAMMVNQRIMVEPEQLNRSFLKRTDTLDMILGHAIERISWAAQGLPVGGQEALPGPTGPSRPIWTSRGKAAL